MFQASSFTVREDRANILRDAKRDVALIPVTEQEVRRSGLHVEISPPAGRPHCPASIRTSYSPESQSDSERKPDNHIEFGSFSSIMRVTSGISPITSSVSSSANTGFQLTSVMSPPALGENLSGASGGPVFSLDHPLHIPLIGLIYEFNPGRFGSDIELLTCVLWQRRAST